MMESYENMSERNTFKRISVLLDKKTFEALNKLMQRRHLKISDVVRISIMHYFQHEVGEKSNLDELEKIAQQLTDGSHLVIDLETLIALLNEANNKKLDKVWEIAERDGFKQGTYYKSIGISDFVEILKQMELKNWFRLRMETENCYLLILPAPELQKYIKHFIKGLSEALNINVKVKEIGERNLIIRVDQDKT